MRNIQEAKASLVSVNERNVFWEKRCNEKKFRGAWAPPQDTELG